MANGDLHGSVRPRWRERRLSGSGDDVAVRDLGDAACAQINTSA